MRDRKIYGGATKTVEHGEKMLAVVFKYDWCRSAVTLFHLWASWDTFGPSQGQVQRDPLNQRPLQETAGGACGLFAERQPVRIAEMADGLVRGHLPPQSPVGRTQRGKASFDRTAINR
jgi:hypothetical protein